MHTSLLSSQIRTHMQRVVLILNLARCLLQVLAR